MSEQLKVSAGDACTDASSIDEFYVRRINWLIAIGRPDLIDEIADDCERRCTAPDAAGSGRSASLAKPTGPTPAAHRPSPIGRAATSARDRGFADDNTVGQPPERYDVAHDTRAAVRPQHAVHHGPRGQAGPRFVEPPSTPVETGTRLAVARLRRMPQHAYRHVPQS